MSKVNPHIERLNAAAEERSQRLDDAHAEHERQMAVIAATYQATLDRIRGTEPDHADVDHQDEDAHQAYVDHRDQLEQEASDAQQEYEQALEQALIARVDAEQTAHVDYRTVRDEVHAALGARIRGGPQWR